MNTNLPSTDFAITSDVLLIASPVPRLDEFLQATDTNFIRLVDKSKIQFTEVARYLICLEQAANPHFPDSPVTILRNLSVEVMQSVHYSFLVAASREEILDFRTAIRARTSKCFTPFMGVECVLGTGSLHDWYETIVCNAADGISFGLRSLANKIQIILERSCGLTLVFDNYSKVGRPDRTFILEKK